MNSSPYFPFGSVELLLIVSLHHLHFDRSIDYQLLTSQADRYQHYDKSCKQGPRAMLRMEVPSTGIHLTFEAFAVFNFSRK